MIDVLSPRFRVAMGAIGFVWSLTMATLGFMHYVDVDGGVFASVVGFSSGLMAVGIFVKKEIISDNTKQVKITEG